MCPHIRICPKRSVFRRVESAPSDLDYTVLAHIVCYPVLNRGDAGSMIVLRTCNLGGFRGGVQREEFARFPVSCSFFETFCGRGRSLV